MCGIAGIVTASAEEDFPLRLERMLRAQEHRGPDSEGSWSGRVGGFQVGLAHNRLAILDLSDAGREPMFLPDGNQALIYNGEVYNYKELQSELESEGVRFRTQCDAEVVLWALARWGERAVAKFNGMWAFAWLDLRERRLVLSRDRFGIKPLYLYRGPNALFFASEIKAILAGSGERFGINPLAAGRFIDQSLLDAQAETFFSKIEALPAGHNLVAGLDGASSLEPRTYSYWSPSTEAAVNGDIAGRISEVRETFTDAVRIRLRSDVPVGVLLSGGVDSSSIAAVMRRVLGRDANLHVISAVSDDGTFDEKPFIDQMTAHLECPVHLIKLRSDPSEWFRLVGDVTHSNDEPIGSFSTVAHHLLMREAKRLGITVILSGQGADELLCGYFKYTGFYLRQLIQQGRIVAATRLLGGFVRRGTVLRQFEFSEARRYLGGLSRRVAIDIRGPALKETDCALAMGLAGGTVVERQRADLYRFSVPALVHYEDRSSMASSREIRLPFLDYRLVNLLLPLDPQWKLRDGWTKWIFRQAIKDWLPPPIVWRKDKQGFINPQGEWLKHELRPAIERFLREDLMIVQSGLVDRDALARRYQAYCAQPPLKGTYSFKDIFNPIAMELWARRFSAAGALK
jgi:asparagine synthase (glutamine-hydrolysing)